MLDWLLRRFGLVADPPPDERLRKLDRRSRKAVNRAANQLHDDDLRRLAGMSAAVSHYRQRREREEQSR